MPVISRAQIQRQLTPGLKALWGLEYAKYPEEWKEIFEYNTSEKAFEEELKLSGFGSAPVKNEGSAVVFDSAQEAWAARYTHETVALGFAITEEAMEDNLYTSMGQRYTKALARAMQYTKEVKAAAILNRAFNSSYKGGDTKELCATDHPLVGGGTVSNKPAAGADLNETSLESAIIQMSLWTDERGLLIAAKPKKLIVPPASMYTAKRILDSDLRVGTADNDLNAIKAMGSIPQGFRVNHYLTDTNAFFILTDVPNGLKMFQRRAVKFDQDDEFNTGSALYKASERHSFGWSDPLGVFGSPGAS